MHPRLDAENRRLVRADLDRRVERRARGAVDRAFVAARVRQPPLQRNNVLATASGRVGQYDGKSAMARHRPQGNAFGACFRPSSRQSRISATKDQCSTSRARGQCSQGASAAKLLGSRRLDCVRRVPHRDREGEIAHGAGRAAHDGVLARFGELLDALADPGVEAARIGSLRDGSRGNLTKDFLVFRIRASLLLVRFDRLVSRSHECSRPPYYHLARVGRDGLGGGKNLEPQTVGLEVLQPFEIPQNRQRIVWKSLERNSSDLEMLGKKLGASASGTRCRGSRDAVMSRAAPPIAAAPSPGAPPRARFPKSTTSAYSPCKVRERRRVHVFGGPEPTPPGIADVQPPNRRRRPEDTR